MHEREKEELKKYDESVVKVETLIEIGQKQEREKIRFDERRRMNEK
jgi:uncharacterized membrane protein